MLESVVEVVNPLGLHARAAAKLVRLAGSFRSKVMLHRIDRDSEANAKSILSVLALAAGHGTKLQLRVEGEDEATACEAIKEMFAAGFGELAD